MNYFLVVVICIWGECNNFITTEPAFKTREDCAAYSQTVVPRIQKQLPESSGTTYCFNEQELSEITDELLNQQHEQLINNEPKDI